MFSLKYMAIFYLYITHVIPSAGHVTVSEWIQIYSFGIKGRALSSGWPVHVAGKS